MQLPAFRVRFCRKKLTVEDYMVYKRHHFYYFTITAITRVVLLAIGGAEPPPLAYATVEINKIVAAVVPLTLQVTKIFYE